ncbi:MAG: hypothetical protein ACKOQ1_04655, partial [Actinomycetota bacterium]
MSETAQAVEQAPEEPQFLEAPKKKRRRPIPFYLAGGWLVLLVLLGLFGWALPLPKWDESDFDYLGSA